jgi:hypothetical protein
MDSALIQPPLVPLGEVASADSIGGTSGIHCRENNSEDSAALSATHCHGTRALDVFLLIFYLATAFALVSSQTAAPVIRIAEQGVVPAASAAPTTTVSSSSSSPLSIATVHRSFSSPRKLDVPTHTTGINVVASPHHGITFKPILIEVGAILLLEALGLSVFSKLGAVLRRIRWARLVPASRRLLSTGGGVVRVSVSRVVLRQLRFLSRFGSRLYKSFVQLYSRTSASKIVTRAKKFIKVMMLPHDDNEHEHDETKEAMKSKTKSH